MNFSDKLRFWVAKLLIRTGKLKQVKYDAEYLNPLIVEFLPHQETFEVPGGMATLTVLTADITIGDNNAEGLHLKLLCSFEVTSLNQQLYRAHVNADIKARPFYHQTSKSIRISEASVAKLSLIDDEYLMINTPADMLKSFTPKLFKGLVDATINTAFNSVIDRAIGSAIDTAVGTAKVVMGDLTPPVKDYLDVFTQLNKQKVLDFHRPQIQLLLTELIEQGDLCYQLTPDDFEEQLFALFGKQMDIENNHLVFKFS